jgi:hypothetical protein
MMPDTRQICEMGCRAPMVRSTIGQPPKSWISSEGEGEHEKHSILVRMAICETVLLDREQGNFTNNALPSL